MVHLGVNSTSTSLMELFQPFIVPFLTWTFVVEVHSNDFVECPSISVLLFTISI